MAKKQKSCWLKVNQISRLKKCSDKMSLGKKSCPHAPVWPHVGHVSNLAAPADVFFLWFPGCVCESHSLVMVRLRQSRVCHGVTFTASAVGNRLAQLTIYKVSPLWHRHSTNQGLKGSPARRLWHTGPLEFQPGSRNVSEQRQLGHNKQTPETCPGS